VRHDGRRHDRERTAALEALRRDDSPFGAAIRAIDRAEALGLPPDVAGLAGEVVETVAEGWGRAHWLRLHASTAAMAVDPTRPRAAAAHRLEQLIRILADAGFWPSWW
jgi:hypothetical protein